MWPFRKRTRSMPEPIVLAGDSYNRICAALGVTQLSPDHAVTDKRLIIVSGRCDIHRVRDLPRSTKWFKLGSLENDTILELFHRFGKPQSWKVPSVVND